MFFRLIINDIIRKKYDSTFYIIGTSLPLLSSFIISQLLSYSLGTLELIQSINIPLAFQRIFRDFFFFLWVISLFSSMVSASALSYFMAKSRQRDIFIMKVSGATTDAIYTFFVFRILFLSTFSFILAFMICCFFSIFSGMPMYNYLMIISTIFFFVTVYYAGYNAAVKAVQMKTSQYYLPSHLISLAGTISGVIERLSWKSRYAIRLLKKAGKISKFISYSIFISFFIVAFTYSSYFTFIDTSEYYIYQSTGKNVVAIGTTDMVFFYKDFLSFKSETKIINLTEQLLPEILTDIISNLSFVEHMEKRLILYGTVKAIVSFSSSTSPSEIIRTYTKDTYLVGVDFENTISKWVIYGSYPNASHHVLIGDTLDTYLVREGTLDAIYIFGYRFIATAICLTIENSGDIVYISLDELKSLSSINGYNLLLVQLSKITPSFISELSSIVNSAGLNFIIVDDIVNENISALYQIWQHALLVSLAIVISILIVISTFIHIELKLSSDDLRNMFLIGASKKSISDISFTIGVISVIQIFIPAYVLGSILGFIILFRQAFLTYTSLFIEGLTFLLLLAVFVTLFKLISLLVFKKSRIEL